MSGFAGRRLRISVNFGSGLVNLGGAQTDSLTINRETIDVTDKDDTGVRRLLEELGTFSLDLSVEGVLKDDDLLSVVADPTNTTHLPCQILVAGLGTFTGSFQITSFESSGAEGAEALTYTAAFQSSGTITYVSA